MKKFNRHYFHHIWIFLEEFFLLIYSTISHSFYQDDEVNPQEI